MLYWCQGIGFNSSNFSNSFNFSNFSNIPHSFRK